MSTQHPINVDILPFPPQMFKAFEKLADQDRERQLMELQKRQEGQCVPPAVQELEITAESPEGTEEKSVEAPQTASPTLAAGDASTEPADTTTSSSNNGSSSSNNSSRNNGSGSGSSSSGVEPQGHQTATAAASAHPEE